MLQCILSGLGIH